jgi:hypothetical protein
MASNLYLQNQFCRNFSVEQICSPVKIKKLIEMFPSERKKGKGAQEEGGGGGGVMFFVRRL